MAGSCTDFYLSPIESSLKVAVLAGGIGPEREVSIESGRCVARALQHAGVNAVVSDIAPDDAGILGDQTIGIFFLALHGPFGEDGRLQQILQEKSLLYTGSGPQASRLAFDKVASKKIFAQGGIAVPRAVQVSSSTNISEIAGLLEGLSRRFVAKPARQGSSVGIMIVDDWRRAVDFAVESVQEFGEYLIEEYIEGREITVGILGEKVLPIIEVRSKTGFYDYHAKYVDSRTEYLFDTIRDSVTEEKIRSAALSCFNLLGCRDFARGDFILGADGTVYALEVNTIPGFTSHSLLPMAAARMGLSMSDVCVYIVRCALQRRN